MQRHRRDWPALGDGSLLGRLFISSKGLGFRILITCSMASEHIFNGFNGFCFN